MYLPSFRLEDKVALVTGAGRGIGKALAIGLAEAGANVVLVARSEGDLRGVAEEIERLGRKAYPIRADITEMDNLDKILQTTLKWADTIDILVNNAGTNIRTPAHHVTNEEWEMLMQLNLKSAFFLSQKVAQVMQSNGGGKIINISSVAGHVSLRTGVVYGATKAAMIQMTKNLAVEWAPYGITVNSIGPWYFRTPITEKLLDKKEYLQDILVRTPMKRIGVLEELVGPVVFLASDGANYITGQTLFVDGGMSVYGF
ncbi:SDR family NAD(P)-dependent oxidoreductase [Ammoniphilus resinae]|uniref:NAD(P)-dependent dehydrogenase (Short-subunit alcohol dehydrogenase family) n=1 Tax=Ammoniphilus resinae TaxID=861532 RepID=A0ABS4GWP3_9BACL|nr:glucose 1-dehydrogenase [Ammoniphilus resinae]MBP1934703.1 NAD(P)-dependent dehydrogenase (short-subunit alcohol dehydrogenase family) [Ammoniphilus resinae]